jgi:hypothetical protein
VKDVADSEVAFTQALLTERVAPHGGPLDIEVTGGCGGVEVRVAGPTGELRLPFDRAELNPAYALRVVSHAVERYGTSLVRPFENLVITRRT